jgi:hypothetical protein
MIQSPRNMLGRQARVTKLIDHDTRQWKGDLVFEIFFEEEAKVIKVFQLAQLLQKTSSSGVALKMAFSPSRVLII